MKFLLSAIAALLFCSVGFGADVVCNGTSCRLVATPAKPVVVTRVAKHPRLRAVLVKVSHPFRR